MNGGLEMDPNLSSFLPLIFVLHNSTNLSSTICLTIVLPYGLVSYHPLLTILLQPLPCLNFFSFLSIDADKVHMYRNPQQKCKYLNFGPS